VADDRLTFRLPSLERKGLEAFCLEHDLTVAHVLRYAVRLILSDGVRHSPTLADNTPSDLSDAVRTASAQRQTPASRARGQGPTGSLPTKEDQPQDQPLLSPDGDTFDDFWTAYPRHPENSQPGGGAPKSVARKSWAKLKPAEHGAVMVGLRNYADDCRRPNAPVAHASTWLNQRRWEDWQEPAVPNARAPNSDGLTLLPNGDRVPL